MQDNLPTDEEKTRGSKKVVLKRIMKIPLMEGANNIKVVRKMAAKRTLILKMRKRQLKFLGYNKEGGIGKLNHHRAY